MPGYSLCRDQISPNWKWTLTPICLPKSERIGKMLFSLWALKTATDQREKSNPSRRLPCGQISEITSKKKETFNCLMPLCSTWPWLWILEAPEVACGLWYNRPKIPSGWEWTLLSALSHWNTEIHDAAKIVGCSDFSDSGWFAEVWKKAEVWKVWTIVEGMESITPVPL